jgi:hypothetical protein
MQGGDRNVGVAPGGIDALRENFTWQKDR